jgi:rhamnosyltransferase
VHFPPALPLPERSHDLRQSTEPRVLVLLAAFNGQNWIEAQLDSILSQQGVCVSIVVADDASTDETRRLITNYATDCLTLVTRRDPTGSAAQNFFAMIREVGADGFDSSPLPIRTTYGSAIG